MSIMKKLFLDADIYNLFLARGLFLLREEKNIKLRDFRVNERKRTKREGKRKTQKPVVMLFIERALRVMSCEAH